LNFPGALAEIHKLAESAHATSGAPADAADELAATLNFIGFEEFVQDSTKHAEAYRSDIRNDVEAAWNEVREKEAREAGLDPNKVDQDIKARLTARKVKNWAEADRIRDELVAQGILLKDAKDPETGEIVTTWEIAR
jgi:cysteinyl-tRNA synthetase